MSELQEWIGRSVVEHDELGASQARALAATLDRDPAGLAAGDALPPGWHWVYFRPLTRRSDLAADGHARRGGFLPPVSLPRRMWVGGRVRFLAPLTLGRPAEKRSTIVSVSSKSGRSGDLVFVTVRHEIGGPGAVAIEEEQDLVYREAAAPGAAPPPPPEPPAGARWSEPFLPDATTLFRFSALTFNGHRIHYDHPYATGVEGYPGLVVHGPLTALLLLDAAGRHAPADARGPARFEYRAVSPLFGDEEMTLAGRPVEGGTEAWAAGPRGLVMTASVEWAR